MTIKNIVIADSCSFENSFISSSSLGYGYVAGVIGCCLASDKPCHIDSCVNMANLLYEGNAGDHELIMGGIAGKAESYNNHEAIIKNCANYGQIKNTGTAVHINLGGIVGYFADGTRSIENCINYGNIIDEGSTTHGIRIGGIVGIITLGNSTVDNCVNTGKLSSVNPTDVGSIVGRVETDIDRTELTYCYWTSNTGFNRAGGKVEATISQSDVSEITLDADFVKKLNDQRPAGDLKRWILNSNKKKVTFYVNNKEAFSYTSEVLILPDISSDGGSNTEFDGWYTDAVRTQKFTASEITGDTTLYGIYRVFVDVSFEANGGSGGDLSTRRAVYGNAYGDLPEPTKTGYRFDGWFTKASDGEEVTKDTPVNDPNHHTLYAHWTIKQYSITFKSDGATIKSESLNYGSTITYPASPSKTGHTFNGWDNSITTVPAYDVIINAKWSIISYTITFNTNGGSACDSITQNYATTVTLPTPTKTGYRFDYWCSDSGLTTQYTSNTMPAGNIELHAKWTINQYTISFNTNGGSACNAITQDYNTEVKLPKPTKTGYTFAYWCSDSGLTTQYTGTTMSADNITLYTKWTINQYTITFDYGNGTKTEETLDFDSPIAYPEDVEKEGYTFGGWSPRPVTVPSHNITINANWAQITSEYVEIVFDTKELTKKEAEKFIRELTNDNFIIKEFVGDKGETRVIIKFTDKGSAEDFVGAFERSSEIDLFVRYCLDKEIVEWFQSFSTSLRPLLFLL